ncbi:putative pyruvate formate lyase activating enzyme [Vibrio tapetis subsp. tapetis]|uniref:Putative pyruvate formate lyase activating enzyme n=1 Tax=Vibrio tapetis subsp. tapetis TaxID=1671868 RepID=A0A2N8ZLC2_9VIBR|nr:putative pyruvate formate lyase activating enzyme [Vibrio tapetis subsp. tapetis]
MPATNTARRTTEAVVSKILPFSCVDGPGNWLVIFLQGCNYDCKTCHNPSTINHCNHCGECMDTCPTNAISWVKHETKPLKKPTITWNEARCIQCDQCIATCRFQSSPKTERYSVDELLEVVRQNHLFLSGITMTGGESTLQLKFIIEFFRAIKGDKQLKHLTCFVDSNGSLGVNGWQALIPVMDGAMIDIKSWQPETHLWLTNRNNHRVFQSITLLNEHNKLHEIRLLHVPGKSDFELHASALSQYLKTLSPLPRIKINAYSNHAVVGQAKSWLNCAQSDMQSLVTKFKQQGIKDLVIPSVYI